MPYTIEILIPKTSTYGVLEHFSEKVCQAIHRLGHNCRCISDHEAFTKTLEGKFPDFTLCFNSPPRDPHGLFWSDLFQVPHVSVLVDTPFHFPGLNISPYIILTYDDEYLAQAFKNKRFAQKFFVPHGVEPDLAPDPSLSKIYDVTVLASFIDYEERQKRWEETYPKDIYEAMLKAIDITLENIEISYIKAFEMSYNECIKESRDVHVLAVNIIDILNELEGYLKGYERICQVQAIRDAEVHIFGASTEIYSWERYFETQPNVVIHDAVPFNDALKIMKQSKIILNSNLRNRNGTHERVLCGFAAGALVATSVNPYMQKYFTDGENILFWNFSDIETLNDRVVEVLQNPVRCQKMAKLGREVVMQHFTWDRRMEKLISELGPVLDILRQEA